MNEINFITIGDKNFFPLINYSVKQIFKFYPKAHLFIYDWGFTRSQKLFFQSYSNVKLINWIKRLNRQSGYEDLIFKNKQYDSNNNFKKKQYLYNQKPLCLLDCAKRINENLFYIDGDAFLINKIDELFEIDFDIGVTIRIDDKILILARKKGFRAEINAGIIFFNLDSKGIQIFIQKWIEEIKITNQLWMEQTALNNLIVQSGDNIFVDFYNDGILKIANREFKILTLPCLLYNRYMIKEGYSPKNTKILHLKASEGKMNQERIKEIITQVKIGPFYYKFLKSIPKATRKYIKEIFNIYFLAKFINNPLRIKNWMKEIIKPIIDKFYELYFG